MLLNLPKELPSSILGCLINNAVVTVPSPLPNANEVQLWLLLETMHHEHETLQYVLLQKAEAFWSLNDAFAMRAAV